MGLGLIDGLGECRQIVRDRFGEEVEFMFVEPKRRLLSNLGGLPGSLAGGIVDEAAAVATEKAYFQRYGL